MAKLSDVIGQAVDTGNAQLAGEICEFMRARGANYYDILRTVQKVRPSCTASDWEALLYESESPME